MAKSKYYDLNNLLSKVPEDTKYYMLIGQRSNGKTYACLNHCLEEYFKYGKCFAILRRWDEDFKSKRGASFFNGLIENGVIEKLSGGQWNTVYYYTQRWFMAYRNPDDPEDFRKDSEPFAYAFSISSMEHDKSTSYPMIENVFFDEFLTKSLYLQNEFVLFMNVLSTIIRDRDTVKIFMAANTVNQYAPYFKEMGLTNVSKMKPGDIDLYQFGEEGTLKVAVEFTDMPAKKKPSDCYFLFDNPRLDMITGKGAVWELDIYPHCPYKYTPKDIKFTYFIQFERELFQAEIININNTSFTYIHRKTTPIQNPDKDIIYSEQKDPRPNWSTNITKPIYPVQQKIWKYFQNDQVFYQDNEVGNTIQNFLNTQRTIRK